MHVPLSPSSIIWYRLVDGDALFGWKGNRKAVAESNGSVPLGGWLKVTCGLTACTLGSAPVLMLGIYTVSQKNDNDVTSTHINQFWYFFAEMLLSE